MYAYAWCGSLLRDHLVNTVRAVVSVPNLSRVAEVLARKVSKYCSTPEGIIPQSEAYELVLLTLALHDIGKACEKYQKTVISNGSKCGANFKYHEIVSAAIIAEALSTVTGLNDLVKSIITLSVLNHHHAMRDVVDMVSTYKQAYREVVEYSGPYMAEALDLPVEVFTGLGLRSSLANNFVTALRKVCEECCNEVILSNSIRCLIAGVGGRRGGYNFISGGVKNYYSSVTKYLISALSGLISIADNLSAYCERLDRRNLVVNDLLSELNFTCSALRSNP